MADDRRLSSEIGAFLLPKYPRCCMCEGFYGANFGEPVCSTCHLFLYIEDINYPGDALFVEKADSGDSGNEEPHAESDFYMKRASGQASERMYVPYGPKTDKMAERISNLTCPRDYQMDRLPTPGLVEALPTEVLLVVFRHLNDVSLWTASNVCARWRHILDAEMSEDQWEMFVRLRWPLFNPQYRVHCWRIVYTKLLESAPCRYCLENMMLQSTPPVSDNSWRNRRLRCELKTLQVDPPEGIQATPLDRQCCHWQAAITGPHGSPYEGGLFYLYLQIPHNYPMRPPLVRFITKIFHPNISRHGDVGLDSIHHNWSLALTISKVLVSIQSLLTDPYCHVCMEPAIGQLYLQDSTEFNRVAQLWTWKYAMHDYLMPCNIQMTKL